jgi:alkanesulfonate monooxygenase SsuD/methylene tetrahydromethanopterin reductase-like flavin-dependent oxidoreductase (luciferase family)
MVASAVASGGIDTKLAAMGILSQVYDLRSEGPAHLEAATPDAWIDALAIVGTPEDWCLAINQLVDTGADTVVLVPLPDKGLDEVEIFAQHLSL